MENADSKNDIKKMILYLADEFKKANRSLLYIEEFLDEKYKNFQSRSNAFFGELIDAFFTRAKYHLFRAYDDSDDSLSLKNLLNRIKENDNAFSLSVSLRKKLDSDIRHLKETCKNLIRVRHKNGFHMDENIFLGKKILDISIPFQEIKNFAEQGLETLNFYSSNLYSEQFSVYLLGFGDHEFLKDC